MSLFCITQSREEAELVKKDYDAVFPENNNIYELESRLFVTVTSGFQKKIAYKMLGNDHIFIFGTIFNQDGFNEELINKIDNYEEFLTKAIEGTQNFYGHYIIVGFQAQKQCLEIITDRIGCLNVYYSYTKDQKICIGNDVFEVARVSRNTDLDLQAVGEFLMTESNVNDRTFFQDVMRLGFGKGLFYENNRLSERHVYEYRIESLSVKEYQKRIDKYFGYIENYNKDIEVDISAGFDTRLIAAISHKNIPSFTGFSNRNRYDGGIDAELSPIISDLLGITCHTLDYEKVSTIEDQSELIWHGTSCLRDSERSKIFPTLFSYRYNSGSLSLGGYGGEIMRAKYNIYPDMKQFISYYYKGYEAEKICGLKGYQRNVRKELEAYYKPQALPEEMEENWYYAVAKMRIWGSAFLQMATLYGDIIHPFMDWFLMGPVFGFSLEELKKGKLQDHIIQKYAPELKDIPYNKHMNAADNPPTHDWIERILSLNWEVRHIFQYLRMKVCYAKEAKILKSKIQPSVFPTIDGLDLNRILLRSGAVTSSRMLHILNVKKQLDSIIS